MIRSHFGSKISWLKLFRLRPLRRKDVLFKPTEFSFDTVALIASFLAMSDFADVACAQMRKAGPPTQRWQYADAQ